jgi:hypothetical protein
MPSTRADGLLEEARTHSGIGTFYDCENHFKCHRNGHRRQGMTTHSQFTTLADGTVS